jgi:hypothetical protein
MEDGEKMVNVFAYTTRYLTRKENIENATLNNFAPVLLSQHLVHLTLCKVSSSSKRRTANEQ